MKLKLRPKDRSFAPVGFWLTMFAVMIAVRCLFVYLGDDDWTAKLWVEILATSLLGTTFATLCLVFLYRRKR